MHNVIVNGLDFYELPDGSLFPVLAGAKGDAPAPAQATDEEKNLMNMQAVSARQQLKIAQQQQAENEALMPVMLKQYGLTRTVDPKTGKISYTQAPDADADKRKEIEGMQLDRSLKALKGELPVTATLANELEVGERTLNEKLSRQLGPGWETSSAGIQAKAEYNRMATSLREAEQKDQLTTAEALSIQRQGSRTDANTNLYDTVSRGNAGASSLFNNSSGSAGNGLQYYGTLRDASMRARDSAAQERGGYAAAGMSAIGLGAGMFMASDPELKTDIEDVADGAMLLAVRKMPVKRWRYKDDPEKRMHVGAMADTMPEDVSDKKVVDVISYLGMITGAVRALDKKLERESLSPALLLAS